MQTDQPSNNDTKFPNTVNGIAARIAFQLGDLTEGDAYATFDREWLQARITDTLKWLQGRKPALFATSMQLTLEPGQRHPRPDNCDKLFEITELIDDKGRCHPVCEAKYKDLLTSMRTQTLLPDCMLTHDIYHFAFNPHNENQFLFSPTITVPTKVNATCSDVQSYLNDPDKVIDCEAAKYINMLVAYVLSQAAAMDSENPLLLNISEQNLGIFRDMAPMRKREDDDRNS